MLVLRFTIVPPPTRAIADLTEFLQRQPRVAAGWARRGTNYAESGDIEGGLRDCNKAVQLEPRNAYALALRADVYRLASRYREALRDANRAIEIKPDLPRAYQVKGRVYEERKDYQSAITQFTKVMKLLPKWPNPLVARAYSYAAFGNYRAALEVFRKGLRLFPNSARVHDGFAWLLATCPQDHWRDGKRAVGEATRECTATGRKDSEFIDTLAAALAETREFDQAIKRQQQAIEITPAYDRKDYELRLASYREH